jgi:hypothetical protein
MPILLAEGNFLARIIAVEPSRFGKSVIGS